MGKQQIVVVWLKRDLRLQDHAALHAAMCTGLPVLLLYVFEPSMMQLPDYDERHARFVWQCLQDINRSLRGQASVAVARAEVTEVLEHLLEHYRVVEMHSHQETGNAQSYARDKAVKRWCNWHGINWQEHNDRGIVRGLANRQSWPKQWYWLMELPPITCAFDEGRFASQHQFPQGWQVHKFTDLFPQALDTDKQLQPGGTTSGRLYLNSFLGNRAASYNLHISKPLLSRTSCSRLSPYLAYGCLSMRQVYQASRQRITEAPQLKRPLTAFLDRLRWHSHFMQKLESRPSLEWADTNPGFSAIRQQVHEPHLQAWMQGHTGIPMVDACMQCLHKTGYLNFRMRAMLVSFLTHHLWQPWQAGVHHLARLFLDYEPGIHYPQFQMQAGVTGINTIRIYNPVKQGLDHDADGVFIKAWLPTLQHVPAPLVHTPWKLTTMEQMQYGCRLGADYPLPVVNVEDAARHARDQLWRIKASKGVKQHNRSILQQLSGRSREDEQGA